jgi:hypothetical protein
MIGKACSTAYCRYLAAEDRTGDGEDDLLRISMRQQVLEKDERDREAMMLRAETGQSFSLSQLREVADTWQKYMHRILKALAQHARGRLDLTGEDRENLEQYPHFLESFMSLQDYWGRKTCWRRRW